MESNLPVALVTGSSRGIGRAIALELAGAGYDLVVNCRSDLASAEETAGAVRQRGREAIVVQADVASESGRERLVSETRAAFGRIDVLVNNAALSYRERTDILDAREESYRKILAANLEGPFFLTQKVARWMVEIRERNADRGLYVINVSSLSEYTSSVNRADYCLAKAGLGMLTKLFADRLAEHAILVNAVRPGIVATDMTSGARERYDPLIAEGLVPLRRWGRPRDVARAVRALVSGDFDFSTGASFDVDGGFHLRRL